MGLLQMMLNSGYAGASGDGARKEWDANAPQMLAAHLQQADPIMYDIIEKVCGVLRAVVRDEHWDRG